MLGCRPSLACPGFRVGAPANSSACLVLGRCSCVEFGRGPPLQRLLAFPSKVIFALRGLVLSRRSTVLGEPFSPWPEAWSFRPCWCALAVLRNMGGGIRRGGLARATEREHQSSPVARRHCRCRLLDQAICILPQGATDSCTDPTPLYIGAICATPVRSSGARPSSRGSHREPVVDPGARVARA